MHPILFQKGFLTIYSYGVMVAIAFFVVLYLSLRQAKKQNVNAVLIYDLGFWIILSGIIGARLAYVFMDWPFFKKNLLEIIMINHGGLVFYGGLIFSLITAVIYLKIKKQDVWKFSYIIIPYVPLGHAIGRIGCFLNGCCYGRYPVQLYESFLNFLIFLILIFSKNKIFNQNGKSILGFYLISYGLVRFILEFLRSDEVMIIYFLRISQWMSLGIMILGVFLIIQKKLWNKK